MNDDSQTDSRKALAEILALIGLSLIGIIVFSAIGLGVAKLILDAPMEQIQEMMSLEKHGPKGRIALLILQGIISLGSFVAMPALVRFFFPNSQFSKAKSLVPNFTLMLLVSGLGMLMMPVNGWLSVWNQRIQMPSFLQEFQNWAMAKEQEMEKLTLFLVDFQSPLELILGFIVISLIAGLSEEFFFRKMLQPRMMGLTGNIHVAIWFTAFIFSAIHMQFYGLIPRMALGALFGYYYYWTGNIWVPVFAHSFNNGVTLIGMYLYQHEISPLNVDDPKQIPTYLGAVAAGLTWSLASMVKDEADKINARRKARLADQINTTPVNLDLM
ncbi:MAG TPA: type II CAAX endopeptidase family protein [Catalimonadaceae bacterium]|nr:type II CAAX endopeptidase family protein [Catalimonadaceae bacterium]